MTKNNKNKQEQLSGKNNQRLHSTTPVNSEYTSALANKEGEYSDTNVAIPSLQSVEEAKDWVDNGSRT